MSIDRAEDNDLEAPPAEGEAAKVGLREAVAGVQRVVQKIEQGEEPRRIFATIVETAMALPGVNAAAILLPSDNSTEEELIIDDGSFSIEGVCSLPVEKMSKVPLPLLGTSYYRTHSGFGYSFQITNLGTQVGRLVITSAKGLSEEACIQLHILAHHTGVVVERQKLANTVQHFLDRLQVLNQLNNLIAGNVGLQGIVKSIARECAFRFAADVALTLVLNEDRTALEFVKGGGYGCAPHLIPTRFDLGSGMLSQVIQVGGHLSIPNLSNHAAHGLKFLENIGIRSVDAYCLEVRGEPLGIILIGYRRENFISVNDLNRFQEFCQGAAVAIANARAQERLQVHTMHLETLVADRTRELERQSKIADEANHAKSQFLANMSHELRTPLTAIVGYSSVLADGIFGPLNDKQSDALNAITRSSEHLKNLIDDVLNLARIESGKEEPEPSSIGMKDLLLHAHKIMMQPAIGKGLTLKPFQLDDSLKDTAIFADVKHLHQIVINLMGNAIKYTPKGGSVWVTAEVIADKVRILVHDTGVGISDAKKATLFERFERGDDAYSKGQEGTGIGLNLTRRLVELNGGRIGVESEEGKGSSFWIMMPLASGVAAPTHQTGLDLGHEQLRLEGLSTLVVDDNRDTCEVLSLILTSAGASVRIAHSVREGIEVLGTGGLPDIVLTDLAMPGESGLVLIEHVRNMDGSFGQVPIIVLSACAFDTDKNAAITAGASIFMAKPFKPHDILKHVRDLTLNSAIGGRA